MRLGLFGGTFDPPHAGHLIVAQDAMAALGLDRIVFIPAAVPPHKRDRAVTAAEIRAELIAAAIAGDARFAMDDLELRRAGPSYTVDTLRLYRERDPGAVLFLLVGADQYAELDTWRRPDEIRRLATIAVLSRAAEPGGPAEPVANAVRVSVTRIDLSSTEVRERVRRGLSIRYLVPDGVAALIRERGLYRDQPEGRLAGS